MQPLEWKGCDRKEGFSSFVLPLCLARTGVIVGEHKGKHPRHWYWNRLLWSVKFQVVLKFSGNHVFSFFFFLWTVVEAPNEMYLDALLDSIALAKHQASACCDTDKAKVVLHFTPQDVMVDPRYQEWMSRFSASTDHIIINDVNLCQGLVDVHTMQYKLNHLNNTVFPLLKDNSIPVFRETDSGKETVPDRSGFSVNRPSKNNNIETRSELNHGKITRSSVYQACTNLTYHIRPHKRFDR